MVRSYTAAIVAKVLFEKIYKLYGLPRSIVCDRDLVFVSQFGQELLRLQGVTFNMSSASHPQTDGQSEAVNRSIEMYLRCFSGDSPRALSGWLPWTSYCCNTAFHASLRSTPYQVLHGRLPPNLLKYVKGTAQYMEVERLLLTRDTMLLEIK